MLLAALISPWLYDAGKVFASRYNDPDAAAILQRLAGSCERARFERYFSRSLLISALVLLPFLYRYIRNLGSAPHAHILRSLSWKNAGIHFSAGLGLGALALGILGAILMATDAATPKPAGFGIADFFSKALLPALGAGFIEEWIFRGVLLGLWLRSGKIAAAIIGSSLMFAFVHFLKPPSGTELADPSAWNAGFVTLSEVIGHFANPLFFVTDFATLTLLGLILACCRLLTCSLWLPIGLHAGLVLALKSFSSLAHLDFSSKLHPWWIGDSLSSGILPLVILGFCFLTCQKIIPLLPTWASGKIHGM